MNEAQSSNPVIKIKTLLIIKNLNTKYIIQKQRIDSLLTMILLASGKSKREALRGLSL